MKRILMIRIRGVQEEVRKMKAETQKEEKYVNLVMLEIRAPPYTAMFYKKEEATEMNREWMEKNMLYSKRLTWLVEKHQRRGRARYNDKLRGVRVTDDEVKKEKIEKDMKEQENYIIFGDIVLDEDEKSYANLPYKFVEHEDLDERKMRVSAEKHSVTERWEMMDNENEKKCNDEDEDTNENAEKRRKVKAENGKVYDKEAATIDLSKLRVTDIPTNTRIFEPKPAKGSEEVKIQVQKNEILKTFTDYVKKECDEKGKIRMSNLTMQQVRGKKK